MIDFHNHVLPDVDDGPKTLEQSLNMLRSAAEQGITDVVNTVHFQHPKMDDKEITYENIQSRVSGLQEVLDEEGIEVKLHIGAEIFYLPNLVELISDPLCTFGNGRYMLVEFPFHILPEGYDKILFNLVMAGVTPIIAHPERYKPIQKDLEILRKLIRSGCLVQVDGGSVIGFLGRSSQKAALEIIGQRLCHVLGTDAHDDRRRNFSLRQAVATCREIVGDDVDDMVSVNPSKILNGEKIVTDIEEVYIKPGIKQKVWNKFIGFMSR